MHMPKPPKAGYSFLFIRILSVFWNRNTCWSGRVFWGGVGSGVWCLFYKHEHDLIQNAYIMNCQSDFLQLFLSDVICPIWLRRCARCMWYRKSYSLQRTCSIHMKTTGVLKHYLNAFLHISLLKFVQNPQYSYLWYYFLLFRYMQDKFLQGILFLTIWICIFLYIQCLV